MRNTSLRVCSSTTTKAACTTITRCGLRGWRRTRRSTRPAQGPVAQPHRRGGLSRTDRTADAHLKRHGPPSAAVVVAVTNGRLDFGTWERIFGVSWIADTGVLTGDVGSGCWSRSSGSDSTQSYPDINGRQSLYLVSILLPPWTASVRLQCSCSPRLRFLASGRSQTTSVALQDRALVPADSHSL